MQSQIVEHAPKQAIEKIKEAWGARWVQDDMVRQSLSQRDGGQDDEADAAHLEKLYGQHGSEVI